MADLCEAPPPPIILLSLLLSLSCPFSLLSPPFLPDFIHSLFLDFPSYFHFQLPVIPTFLIHCCPSSCFYLFLRLTLKKAYPYLLFKLLHFCPPPAAFCSVHPPSMLHRRHPTVLKLLWILAVSHFPRKREK